jgi:hypothetical protein
VAEENLGKIDLYSLIHTNLYAPWGRHGRKEKVAYSALLDLGAPADGSSEFYWFWRSGLKHYHRHAKIWQKWLNRMLVWSHMVHYRYKDEWMSGFQRYDRVSADSARELDGLKTWAIFNKMCDSLLADLRQATPVETGN